MKAEVKDKWVAALRSGQYLQTQGFLRQRDPESASGAYGYCCLGVLCDVVGPDQWEWSYERKDEDFYGNGFLADDERAHRLASDNAEELSDDATHELGITHDQQCELVDMNDSKGLDFIQIADWIEQNIEAEAA